MDIASLKTVLLVESHGSLAGAARVLNVDPSSVSRVVAAVEAELGLRLFQRTTRRLTVTQEGRLYLQRLAPLVEEIDAAREEAVGTSSKPTGLLRLTASVAFSHEVVVPLLPEFQKLYPSIMLDLQSTDVNLDMIENGIDLALRMAPAPASDLVSTRLVTTQYRVVASPEYLAGKSIGDDPQVLSDLNCICFALPKFQNFWRFRKGPGASFDVPVDGNLLISNALALRKAVQSGLGVGLMADLLIREDLAAGRLVDIFPGYHSAAFDFDTAVWALYPSRVYLPRKVRVMVDFLKEKLRG